jgi:hypothetical protein
VAIVAGVRDDGPTERRPEDDGVALKVRDARVRLDDLGQRVATLDEAPLFIAISPIKARENVQLGWIEGTLA